MDPFFVIGAFILGVVFGRVQAQAELEPLFQELRRRVRAAEETVNELEAQEQPELEKRLLERLYRQ